MTSPEQPSQAQGTIRVVVQNVDAPATGSLYVPPLSLTRLILDGPAHDSIGPLTYPENSDNIVTTTAHPGKWETASDTASGISHTSGGALYLNCPSVKFNVKPNRTTTLTFNQNEKTPGSIDFLCKVDVSIS